MTNGSYLRVGDSDRKLTPYEVQLMVEDRGQPRHDEEPVASSSVDDLDPEILGSYFDRIQSTRPRLAELPEGDRLVATKIVTGEDSEVSVAGLWAFGRFPQAHFPQLNLTFVHFVNEDGSTEESGRRFHDNVTFDGPITQIVSDLEGVLRRNMARRASVEGIRRVDSWEYPEAALREAVVNGLAHRDLSPASLGTQVQVEMFPDRLVVRSPGGLYGPVTIETLGEGVSSSRNAALLRLLEDTTIPGESAAVCENRGSGIRTMLGALRSAGMQPPEFADRVSSFEVTFPSHALLSEDVVEWINSLGHEGLTETQVIGLALMRKGVLLDNSRYRAATGVDSRIATMELQDLVGREIAAQHGVKRWAQYSLAEDSDPDGEGVANGNGRESPPKRPRREPANRRPEILRALGEETLSRAEIAERTGLNDRVVRFWLKVLREEGAVERTTKETQSINARYRSLQPPGQASLFDEST